MTFSHGWVLLFLLLPAALVIHAVLREISGERVAFPVDHTAHSRRLWLTRLITGAQILPALVLAVAVLILAGPRRLAAPQQDRVLTNIEIVLDVSGSMMAPLEGADANAAMPAMGSDESEQGPTRYTGAMAAIKEFCQKRKGDAFGLTIFGTEVIRWMPLTKDLSAIQNATPFLNPSKMPPHMGGTRIAHALRYAQQILKAQPEGDRLIILITDGYSSDLDGNVGLELAQQLTSDRIVVHAVCIGGDEPPRELSDAVVPTGGQVFGAGTPNALAGVFTHIDRMQPAKMKRKEPEAVDFYRPLAITGLALLGLHLLGLIGVRWTPW